MTHTLGGSIELAKLIADEVVVLSTLLTLDNWQRFLVPALSAAVDKMIKIGDLPIQTADALDDLGQFCQKLGQDIILERERRGMPMPLGPDD